MRTRSQLETEFAVAQEAIRDNMAQIKRLTDRCKRAREIIEAAVFNDPSWGMDHHELKRKWLRGKP